MKFKKSYFSVASITKIYNENKNIYNNHVSYVYYYFQFNIILKKVLLNKTLFSFYYKNIKY